MLLRSSRTTSPKLTRAGSPRCASSTGVASAFNIASLASLTHTPSPMRFLNDILDRPPHERPFLILVVGHPAADARVPNITRKPFDSIVQAALTAVAAGPVHAVHDLTEGGVLNGLAELAATASTGPEVEVARFSVLAETRQICDHLGLDPLRLLASEALLIGVPPSATADIVAALRARAVPVTRIGSVRPPEHDTTLVSRNGRTPFGPVATDELARFYGSGQE